MKGDIHEVRYDDCQSDRSLTDVIARLESALNAVGTRVHVNPSSRVRRWLDPLRRLQAADRRSALEMMVPSLQQGRFEHPYQDSFRALVDARMFIEIIEQLLGDLGESEIRDLVSGNLYPGDDSLDSRARDREFELFIAALGRRSGLTTRLAEPDVLFDTGQLTFSVAAKRLSGSGGVEKNLSKAAKQIAGANVPGLVLMDVSRILDPTGTLVVHWRNAQHVVGGHLAAFIHSEHNQALQRPRSDLACGVILRAVFPLISEGFRYGTFETWHAVVTAWGDANLTNCLLERLLRGAEGT